MDTAFVQDPPELENQYARDRVLQSYVHRRFSTSVRKTIEPELTDLGEKAGGDLYELQQTDLGNEPTLTQWDAWGERIDHIEVTEVWKHANELAAERGIVSTAYEQEHGADSRVLQMLLAYLFIPSTDMYGCPLAMTDGAARTLLESGNEELVDEAVPHFTSRDPETFWTAGQWMTELAGGSDVGRAETVARNEDGEWRLYGRKWFTSATTANVALALARPEGNPEGGKGLALFYVPVREESQFRSGITVNRLKDKLGTRKLPTAELHLDGALAHPVTELENGTRHMAPMLNVTRVWNAVMATSLIRRGLALARDYARKREAFGEKIINHPLHQETLANVQATSRGASTWRFGQPNCGVRTRRTTRTHRRRLSFDCLRQFRNSPLRNEPSRRRANCWKPLGVPATSRTPGCRHCTATPKSSPFGKEPPTSSLSICCAPFATSVALPPSRMR